MNYLPDNVTEVFNDGTQAYYKVKMNFKDLFKGINEEQNMNKELLNELANQSGLGPYMVIREFPELLERFAQLLEARIKDTHVE